MSTISKSQRRPISYIMGGLVGGLIIGALLYALVAMIVLIIALATGHALELPGLPVVIEPDGGTFVAVDPLGALGWAGAGAILGALVGVWQAHRARRFSH